MSGRQARAAKARKARQWVAFVDATDGSGAYHCIVSANPPVIEIGGVLYGLAAEGT